MLYNCDNLEGHALYFIAFEEKWKESLTDGADKMQLWYDDYYYVIAEYAQSTLCWL